MGTIVDRRTEAHKATHTVVVTATDKGMSGWGLASKGLSKVAWACTVADFEKVLRWVQNRKDMSRVDAHNVSSWRPRNFAHLSIYVVDKGHPSLD